MRSPWSRAALGVLGLLALVATGCTASGNGEPTLTLRVLAATSLTEAMREFAAGYERRHPGVRVRLSFAGSDRLAGQIRQGARVDAYAAAEQRLPHELAREGLVETPQAFAANTLVIAHRRGGTAIDGLRSLARPGVGVGLAAPAVPAGAYARRAIATLAPADRRLVLANVRTSEPDVRGVLAKVRAGAVDAGLVYTTDVRASGDTLEAVALPREARPRIRYEAAAVSSTDHRDAADRFVGELAGPDGARILTDHGFGRP